MDLSSLAIPDMSQRHYWQISVIVGLFMLQIAITDFKSYGAISGLEFSESLARFTLDELRAQERHLILTSSIQHRAGNFVQALNSTRELTAIRKHTLGEKHPRYAASLNNLGELYRLLGQYHESESAFD
jgi:hypothetical protein